MTVKVEIVESNGFVESRHSLLVEVSQPKPQEPLHGARALAVADQDWQTIEGLLRDTFEIITHRRPTIMSIKADFHSA